MTRNKLDHQEFWARKWMLKVLDVILFAIFKMVHQKEKPADTLFDFHHSPVLW